MFINFNGKLINENQVIMSPKNRAFRYGDGIFESIKVADRNIINADSHFDRVLHSCKVLKIILSKSFTQDFFCNEIIKLLEANKHIKSARLRFSIFRNDDGFYKPANNNMSYLIESFSLEKQQFTINKTGLHMALYNEIRKDYSVLSGIKSCNALIYVMASIYASENRYDDCLLLNSKDQIVEATSSNVFIVKNKTLITPPLSDGCVDGTMRKLIIKIAGQSNIRVIEESIKTEEVISAEELFLTNAVSGIKWVSSFQDIKYQSQTTVLLLKKLNESCKLC